MALYREDATGFLGEFASSPGAGYTAITAMPTDTVANRVAWWRTLDTYGQTSSWHPSEYRTPQDPAEASLFIQLSSDGALIAADADGNVTDNYLSGTTTVKVFRGGTDVTISEAWTLTKVDELCASALTLSGGVYTLAITNIPLLATTTGYVRITATRTGSTTLTKDFNFLKVIRGESGSNPKQLTISATSPCFVVNGGTVTPSSVTFSATPVGLSGFPVWYWKWAADPDVASSWNLYYDDGRTSFDYTPTDEASWDVRVNWDGLSDVIRFNRLQTGTTTVTAVIPNDNHTFPANDGGVVSNYAGSGTAVTVYIGSTAMAASATATVSAFRIGTITQTPAASITVGSATYAGTTATIPDYSAFLTTTDSVTLTVPITVYNASGVSSQISKTITLKKHKSGSAVRGSRQILVTNTSGTWNDAEAWSGVLLQTGTAPVLSDLVTIAKSDGTVATSKFYEGGGDGVTTFGTWTTPNSYINGSLLVTGTVAADRLAAGTITGKTIVLDGASSILKSSNYSAGSAGWAIKGDGSAEFRNVTIRGSLNASDVSGGTLNFSNFTASNISASSITTGTLNGTNVTVTNLNATNITTGTLNGVRVGSGVSGNVITTGTLNANLCNVINLNATNITTGTLNASSVAVTNLNATNITTGSMSASRITAGTITADRIEANSCTYAVSAYLDATNAQGPFGPGEITAWSPLIPAVPTGGVRGRIIFHGTLSVGNPNGALTVQMRLYRGTTLVSTCQQYFDGVGSSLAKAVPYTLVDPTPPTTATNYYVKIWGDNTYGYWGQSFLMELKR